MFFYRQCTILHLGDELCTFTALCVGFFILCAVLLYHMLYRDDMSYVVRVEDEERNGPHIFVFILLIVFDELYLLASVIFLFLCMVLLCPGLAVFCIWSQKAGPTDWPTNWAYSS